MGVVLIMSSTTVSTIVSIILMVVGVLYLFIYELKKRTNTQKDIGYRIIFSSIIIILAILLMISLQTQSR